MVGSAWTSSSSSSQSSKFGGDDVTFNICKLEPDVQRDDGLPALAKSQRVSTELQRTIFSIILVTDEYVDAFERLFRLELRAPKVIMICFRLYRDVVNESLVLTLFTPC